MHTHDKEKSFLRAAHQFWKAGRAKAPEPHPDEEDLVCFAEEKLSGEESDRIKAHLVHCQTCAEYIGVQMKLKSPKAIPVSEKLVARAKAIVPGEGMPVALEIVLKLKERVLEIVQTSGDILLGQELVPAPVLRSRQIKDFKDEVTILKDFEELRVEVKVENEQGKLFSLSVLVKEKETSRVMKEIRVTLLKDEVELESYLTESGAVTFEHVLLGSYKVEISNIDKKLAAVILDIKR